MKLMIMCLLSALCIAGLEITPAQAQRRTCEPALTKFACIVVGGTRSRFGEILKPGFKGEEGIARWKRTLYGDPYQMPEGYPKAKTGPSGGHGSGSRRDNYGFHGDR